MRVTDIIKNAEANGQKRFSFELLPPLKGDGIHSIFDAIDSLMPYDPAHFPS